MLRHRTPYSGTPTCRARRTSDMPSDVPEPAGLLRVANGCDRTIFRNISPLQIPRGFGVLCAGSGSRYARCAICISYLVHIALARNSRRSIIKSNYNVSSTVCASGKPSPRHPLLLLLLLLLQLTAFVAPEDQRRQETVGQGKTSSGQSRVSKPIVPH